MHRVAAVGLVAAPQLRKRVGSSCVGRAVVHGVEIALGSRLQAVGRLVALAQLLDIADQAACGWPGLRQIHTVAVLGVVLKQGVCPGGAVAVLVDGVGSGGSGTAPDGGAAGGVGDIHPVAEQLGGQLGIRGLAAAGAGAGELKQGLLELAALDGGLLEFGGDLWLLRAGFWP